MIRVVHPGSCFFYPSWILNHGSQIRICNTGSVAIMPMYRTTGWVAWAWRARVTTTRRTRTFWRGAAGWSTRWSSHSRAGTRGPAAISTPAHPTIPTPRVRYSFVRGGVNTENCFGFGSAFIWLGWEEYREAQVSTKQYMFDKKAFVAKELNSLFWGGRRLFRCLEVLYGAFQLGSSICFYFEKCF